MKHKQEMISTKQLVAIRRALQQKHRRDGVLCRYLEGLLKDSSVSDAEKQIIGYAYEEIEKRVYYVALLDSLWEQIDEIQHNLIKLHIYDSLEREVFEEETDMLFLSDGEQELKDSEFKEFRDGEEDILEEELEEVKFDDEEEEGTDNLPDEEVDGEDTDEEDEDSDEDIDEDIDEAKQGDEVKKKKNKKKDKKREKEQKSKKRKKKKDRKKHKKCSCKKQKAVCDC